MLALGSPGGIGQEDAWHSGILGQTQQLTHALLSETVFLRFDVHISDHARMLLPACRGCAGKSQAFLNSPSQFFQQPFLSVSIYSFYPPP